MAGDEHDGGSFGFDVTVAHPARVYNYLLGGKDNFEAAEGITLSAYCGIGRKPRGGN